MMDPDPTKRFATLAEVEEQLAALATAEPAPPTEPPVIESLLLSKLRLHRPGSGVISWDTTGSGIVRPPERDDSDASITFDLPEAPETLPDALANAPQPNRGAVETPQGMPYPLRPEPPIPASPPSAPAPTLPTADRHDATREPERTADPRLTAPTPVVWHTSGADDVPAPNSPAPTAKRPANSVLWKKVKRNLLFWQASTDTIQVSVFGPPTINPGQTGRLTIFLHPPDAAASVRTLSRAFQHDAELIGTGFLTREVTRSRELAVHLSVANAGVAKTLVKFEWRGQPHRLNFDLHVPWESPEGASPGLVSVGLNNIRIGRVEFRLNVLPRKA
jgi:hypothetical protein